MYCMLECVHCGVTKGRRWCDKGGVTKGGGGVTKERRWCDKGEEVV